MMQFAPVSRERHGARKWRCRPNYGFAATEALVPIVGAELSRAAVSMPLAFVQHMGHYVLVAILSPVAGRNMFVGPDGRWLGGYIPAYLRAQPFRLLAGQLADQVVPCVDEGSGLVSEGEAAGEDFFDQGGNVSPALKLELDFLADVERSRKATDLAISALAQAGVIVPAKTEWSEQAIIGLHHIDERALRALPDDVFLKLRATSALPIAYAQLLSEGQFEKFDLLAKVQAQLTPSPAVAPPKTLDHIFGIQTDDVIRFE